MKQHGLGRDRLLVVHDRGVTHKRVFSIRQLPSARTLWELKVMRERWALSADRRCLAAYPGRAHRYGQLAVFDLRSMRPMPALTPAPSFFWVPKNMEVEKVALSAACQRVATRIDKRSFAIWNVRTGKLVRKISAPPSYVLGSGHLALAAAGRLLLLTTPKRQWAWFVDSGRPVTVPAGDALVRVHAGREHPVFAVQYRRSSLHFFDSTTGKTIRPAWWRPSLGTFTFTPTGGQVLFTGKRLVLREVTGTVSAWSESSPTHR